jgi:hypothetical protein
MKLIFIFFLLIFMGLLTFLNPINYILSNIFLAPLLSTADRIAGGLGVKFSVIKLFFLVFGFLLLSIPRKISLKKKCIPLLILIGILSGADIFASLRRGDIDQWINQDFLYLGLPYMAFAFIVPFFNISASQIVKALKLLVKYLMVPAALYGLFQYIIGPEGVEKLGFTLITPNTENAYSGSFVNSLQRFMDNGLRPFSLFTSSADLGAMMFHGVLWSVILFLNKGNYRPANILLLLTVFAGLLIAQYITTICLTILALFYFYYSFTNKQRSFNKFILYFSLVVLLIGITMAISLPLRYRILGSFQLVSGYGSTTSLATRLLYLSNFEHVINKAPLHGIGLGSKLMFSDIFSADWRILYTSLMLGIPVAICLLSIYLYIYFRAKRKTKLVLFMSDEWKILLIAQLTFLAIILGDFSNGHIIGTGPSNYIAWFLAGAAFSSWDKKFRPEAFNPSWNSVPPKNM